MAPAPAASPPCKSVWTLAGAWVAVVAWQRWARAWQAGSKGPVGGLAGWPSAHPGGCPAPCTCGRLLLPWRAQHMPFFESHALSSPNACPRRRLQGGHPPRPQQRRGGLPRDPGPGPRGLLGAGPGLQVRQTNSTFDFISTISIKIGISRPLGGLMLLPPDAALVAGLTECSHSSLPTLPRAAPESLPVSPNPTLLLVHHLLPCRCPYSLVSPHHAPPLSSLGAVSPHHALLMI